MKDKLINVGNSRTMPAPEWLVRQLRYLIDRMENGCRNHGCEIKAPVGMATNGACRCGERYVARELKDIAEVLLRRDKTGN